MEHVTGTAIVGWFVWGFFMGLGWGLASWIVTRALSRL